MVNQCSDLALKLSHSDEYFTTICKKSWVEGFIFLAQHQLSVDWASSACSTVVILLMHHAPYFMFQTVCPFLTPLYLATLPTAHVPCQLSLAPCDINVLPSVTTHLS